MNAHRWISTVLMALPALLTAQEVPVETLSPSNLLIDFSGPKPGRWFSVNDGVMGGVSRGGMEMTQDGTGLFRGTLSLENNGGFASSRMLLPRGALAGGEGLALRVRGDGRRYQLRLNTDVHFDGVAYRAEFDTREGEWEEIRIPFAEFLPTFRGRTLGSYGPLRPSAAQQMGFMVADKNPGAFALEVAWVKVVQGETSQGG